MYVVIMIYVIIYITYSFLQIGSFLRERSRNFCLTRRKII